MAGVWRTDELPGIVATLATRPKHETLRTLMQDILHSGFGVTYAEMDHEVYLAEGRGRIDTMFGATVIELKSDLRSELPDVFKRLNGIWTFILRNLSRPVWLSREDQRADVLVGNPPWISYRHLSPEMKQRLRTASLGYDLWVGGNLATQQDMCALFWARGAERYLKPGGTIALVLPYAVLNAPVYETLRSGRLNQTRVRIRAGWSLEKAWPIFGSQSGVSTTATCVLFGRREMAAPPPASVERWTGILSRRDATEVEADRELVRTLGPWPNARVLTGGSPYRARFRQGATIVPRRFRIVEHEKAGRLGTSRAAPRVRGKTGLLDKAPWKDVAAPQGPIEAQFLRPILLGETIAPFRVLETALGVIPLSGTTLLDSAAASDAGFRYLAAWLRDAEEKWSDHSNKSLSGEPSMTLSERLDHGRALTVQANAPRLKVAYTTSGTKLSAAILDDSVTIVDYKAYWTTVRNREEGLYLTSIINSATVLSLVAPYQSHGQRDVRDFCKLVWTLPIPEYDERNDLHKKLAAAAARAEVVAAAVPLPDGHFTTKRRAIRAALAADGIAQEIETLVGALLAG